MNNERIERDTNTHGTTTTDTTDDINGCDAVGRADSHILCGVSAIIKALIHAA